MRVKAYLTVYLALSLTVLIAVVMTLLAGVKKNTVRMEEELALDTAGYSVLAEYDRELLKRYDLFFIDVSYGSDRPEVGKTGNRIKDYANKNLQDGKLLESRLAGIGMQDVEVATDYGGEVLKRQIIEYEENYFGLEALENLLPDGWTQSFKEWDGEEWIKKRDTNAERLAGEKAPTKMVEKQRYNEETGGSETYEEEEEVPIEDPAAYVNELRKKGILSLVVEDVSQISDKAEKLENYVSQRRDRMQGTGLLQERAEKNSLLAQGEEKLLLLAYAVQKFGHYGEVRENAALDYQLEYLLGKKGSDAENLRAAVRKLALLREGANAAYLYGDTGKRAEISAMAAGVSAVTLAPYLQPLLETSILFAWAYIESIQDVKLLLEGGRVPLIKTASTWQTDLSNILEFSGEPVAAEGTQGFTYGQYLAALLFFEEEEELLYSMMDVMEMDIRKTAYHENFRMDGCISGFRAAVVFENESGNSSFLRAYYY